MRLGGKAFAVGRDGGAACGWRGGRRGVGLIEAGKTVLNAFVGVVDIGRHLATEHAQTIENLARLGKALLDTITGLAEDFLQLRRIRAASGFAAQALVDKAENPLSDFFRAVIAGLAGQGARLQAQTFGQAIGQGLLGIDTAAGSGLGTGQRCAGGTGGKRGQGSHGGVPG